MKKKTKKKKEAMVEVVRSFSFKKNLGGYEMADFFASAKKSVKESEAESISEALYSFARSEVIKSINSYMREMKEVDTKKAKDVGKEDAQMDAGNK